MLLHTRMHGLDGLCYRDSWPLPGPRHIHTSWFLVRACPVLLYRPSTTALTRSRTTAHASSNNRRCFYILCAHPLHASALPPALPSSP